MIEGDANYMLNQPVPNIVYYELMESQERDEIKALLKMVAGSYFAERLYNERIVIDNLVHYQESLLKNFDEFNKINNPGSSI